MLKVYLKPMLFCVKFQCVYKTKKLAKESQDGRRYEEVGRRNEEVGEGRKVGKYAGGQKVPRSLVRNSEK